MNAYINILGRTIMAILFVILIDWRTDWTSFEQLVGAALLVIMLDVRFKWEPGE